VNPVPDPLLFFSGSAGNRTRASGSVVKNSDYQTTEAVSKLRSVCRIYAEDLNNFAVAKQMILSCVLNSAWGCGMGLLAQSWSQLWVM
jgi:hypothetical protein